VDGVAKVVISPEGDRLAVVTNDGGDRSIWVRNVGEEHFRLLIDGGDPSWPAFSPDGEWIVYEDNNALMRVALSGGAPRPVVPASAGLSPFQPTWGDQGTVVFEADDRLYRVPETGGEPVVLVEGMGSITNPRLLPGESGVLFSIAGDFNSHYLNLGTGEVREIIPGGIAPVYTESGHVVYVRRRGRGHGGGDSHPRGDRGALRPLRPFRRLPQRHPCLRARAVHRRWRAAAP
jgi:dipeptidyl aminopeptidase/acylaminoacyl peptidase